MEDIQEKIYIIRGQRVMLDSDLAKLYSVDTKTFNRQVKRNIFRFPSDFMFKLSESEYKNLRCQNGTSRWTHGGRRSQPSVFTENGVAMLSSVLKSKSAVQINISIMRIFTKLRSFQIFEKEIVNKIEQSNQKVIVFLKLFLKDWTI